jgi:hypothetical protein
MLSLFHTYKSTNGKDPVYIKQLQRGRKLSKFRLLVNGLQNLHGNCIAFFVSFIIFLYLSHSS